MQTVVRLVCMTIMLIAAAVPLAHAAGPEPIATLLITGQNNHDWTRTSPLVEEVLEACGRFDVTVSAAPPKGASQAQWDAWRPAFDQYDVVFSDYNGDLWPEPVRMAFERYVEEGGGVVILHAANNAFTGWEAYQKMIGLGWNGEHVGYRVYMDDEGTLHRLPPGEGGGASHGSVHDWPVTARQPEHPIFQGMPVTWLHAHDELYHAQRGPAENMHLRATAWSSPESRGTGKHEPVVWWIPYGKGKVLTNLLGHLWPGQKELTTFHCVGFRVLLQRCCEWVATGEVTIPIPDNFPTADQVSLVEGDPAPGAEPAQ